MLPLQLADSLAHQHQHELRVEAQRTRLARTARKPERSVRVRVGWWLVATGLRLAVWDRRLQPDTVHLPVQPPIGAT